MRRTPTLLPALALLAALAVPAPAGPAAPPALLVLRVACNQAAPGRLPRLPHRELPAATLRLLPFNETCGAGWQANAARGSLAALGAGSSVLVEGWPGACDVLGPATRALQLPSPHAVCAAPAARSTALAVMAERLHWTRALLPPASDLPGPCEAALRRAAAALLAAGLLLQYDARSDAPHVAVLCAGSPSPAGAFQKALARAPRIVVLLPAASSDYDYIADLIDNADIDQPDLPYKQKEESASAESVVFETFLKALSRNSILPSMNTSKSEAIHNSNNKAWKSSETQRTDRGAERALEPRRYHDVLESFCGGLDAGVRRALLVLSDQPLEAPYQEYDLEKIYDSVGESVERTLDAVMTGIEKAKFNFHLYEYSDSWKSIGFMFANASRRLYDVADWMTIVSLRNVSEKLVRWSEGGGYQREQVALWISAVGIVILLSAGMVILAQSTLCGSRRGSRTAGPTLPVAQFSFPPEERRRSVGEGMEAMLAVWLQQLQTLGGPAPAPDLLPSSTYSINGLSPDKRTRYKGDPVHLKNLPVAQLELKRKAADVLLVMQALRHENINPFIGCLCAERPALVWEWCGRGSLQDVLRADDIRLDWTFRLSLLTDLVRGMRYLHSSILRAHGRLSSRTCCVDSRWVLRVSDYGMPAFRRAQGLPTPACTDSELLWTAPELLREGQRARPTQEGDVFSFGIIMQEVIVRGEPYCMLKLTPEEIIEKLKSPPPLIRPSVSMGAAPPDAVSVMRQCWSEAPELRPDFAELLALFREMHRGRKINIVDSMFEMLEKYSNNLEELIKERTHQLDVEKKKTEQLLNRMLPRSVAERLLLGERVEPEEFSEVSIYFSDIVGFTALAARSTPVQVVDLLNDLYTTFDAAIERYSVYKVETIGDAYMVVGGLPVRCTTHAQAVATMALHLLHLAGRFRPRHLPASPLQLRIGLHSGPVCAAVVGLTMPRYCLFGDTVNTASRMESTGAASRIQVSGATAALLTAAGGYRLRSRGLTQIKGKGAMHTYWLLGKDGFEKPLPTPPPLPEDDALIEADAETESDVSGAPLYKSAALETSSEPSLDPLPPPTATHEAGQEVASNRQALWQHSGAASADSSPPRVDSEPYARYKCLSGGPRALRRQWSLEGPSPPALPVAGALAGAPSALSSRPAPYRTRLDARQHTQVQKF